LQPAAPFLPPTNNIRPLTAEQAAATNAAVAVSAEPLETASPFILSPSLTGELSRRTALDCLTAAIYYEAAGESAQGQRAVAQVVLNRVRHPVFPKSICGVVYQGSERSTGCQFTFTCNGSLARPPSRPGWDRATAIAAAALNGAVEPSVGMATHYHTIWVVPYWADSLNKLATIGAHIFYRWPGSLGKRAAFNGHYLGEAQDAGLAMTQEAANLPGAMPTDLMVAGAAPLSGLLVDETNGQLVPPGRSESVRSPLAADSQSGTLIADERVGVPLPAHDDKRESFEVSLGKGQSGGAP
jgi:spore germination cell wall hydrolase CwlJ-like protein